VLVAPHATLDADGAAAHETQLLAWQYCPAPQMLPGSSSTAPSQSSSTPLQVSVEGEHVGVQVYVVPLGSQLCPAAQLSTSQNPLQPSEAPQLFVTQSGVHASSWHDATPVVRTHASPTAQSSFEGCSRFPQLSTQYASPSQHDCAAWLVQLTHCGFAVDVLVTAPSVHV